MVFNNYRLYADNVSVWISLAPNQKHNIDCNLATERISDSELIQSRTRYISKQKTFKCCLSFAI